MESIGAKQQSEQGEVSILAEPKDVNHNIYTQGEKDLAVKYKVEPKTVRLIAEIVGEHTKDTKGIQQILNLVRDRQEQRAETEQAEKKEPDKSLNEEIAQLEAKEKEALVTFLKGLWEVDRVLTPCMVKCYLDIIRAIVERDESKAKEEKAKQEECKHRDSLKGQAKVDYVLEKLRGGIGDGCYRTKFQRKILELIRDSQPLSTRENKERYAYVGRVINEIFEGCDNSFRQITIDQYLIKVLPELEPKEKEEDASQEAYDNLLEYLCKNKTTEEVVALTEQLKQADAA